MVGSARITSGASPGNRIPRNLRTRANPGNGDSSALKVKNSVLSNENTFSESSTINVTRSSPQDRTFASSLVAKSPVSSEKSHRSVLCVFQFLRMESPSDDEIMFMMFGRAFGLKTAIGLVASFECKASRPIRPLS